MGRIGYGRVEKATRAELRRLGCSVADDSMAAAAADLARQMDLARPGSQSSAALAAELRAIMEGLKKTAVRPEKDAIDELNAQRAKRRSPAAG